MAWIESHQGLERHPKVLRLASDLGIPLDSALGRLHRFWWWVLEYALDGDLREHDDCVIEGACGISLSTLKKVGD